MLASNFKIEFNDFALPGLSSNQLAAHLKSSLLFNGLHEPQECFEFLFLNSFEVQEPHYSELFGFSQLDNWIEDCSVLQGALSAMLAPHKGADNCFYINLYLNL